MEAKILINDGQHRRAAIAQALLEDDTLGEETISVVFFEDRGLEKSQQMFTDLNKHAVKTSNSLAELYDSTDKIAAVTRKLLEQNEFIGKYTDREKDNLSMNSATLFTFNTFYKANKRIICSGKNDEINEKLIIDFWRMVVENIEQWTMLENGELPKSRLRSEYLVCQSVVIEALGQLGNYFYFNGLDENVLIGLRDIDWHRNSKLWMKRCFSVWSTRRFSNGEKHLPILCATPVFQKRLCVRLWKKPIFPLPLAQRNYLWNSLPL